MKRFSIIIPVHNRSALVRQAIDSVLAQTFTDREIIVVDDASTDDTPEVLTAYGESIAVVTLMEQSGCEVARNAGAASAQGEYLAFLDSDDLFFPWTLEVYDFALVRTGQPALLVTRFATFAGVVPESAPGDTVELIVFSDYLARDRRVSSTASMIVVRQDVFLAAGRWRQSTASTFNGSDLDFLLRVGCQGPAILLEHPRAVAYRVHPGNSVRDLDRVVAGIRRLIEAERRGAYPGGRDRWLDRRAVIGNQIQWWSRRSFRAGRPLLALRLLMAGFDMVLVRVTKRLRARSTVLVPVTTFQRKQTLPADRIDP